MDGPTGSEPAAGVDRSPIGVDWRAQLQPEARSRGVNNIFETLKKDMPVSTPEGLNQLQGVAVRFEEKIYTKATSQSDYLRKISLKMLSMEAHTQQAPRNAQVISNQNNSDSTAQSSHAGTGDWQEEIHQMIKSLKDQYFAELCDLFNKTSIKLLHVDSIIPAQNLLEQYEKMKSFKLVLDRILEMLQISKSTIQPAMRDKIPQYEKQIISILNSQRRKPVQPQVQQQLQPPAGSADSTAQTGHAGAGQGEMYQMMGSKPNYMPFQHLKDITDNFCDERIIGIGGFGVVYKGVLQSGQVVAVKKLVQGMPSSEKQFENEVNFLMKIEHPNIVRLVGYCYETVRLHTPYEGDFVFAENIESLLCLECLPNGSLDVYISGASSGLDWHTRWKIIEGISFGLQYLHEQPKGPIAHLDLKPANILLDENMVPKIADFGLSRLFDKKQTILTALLSGTLGYMPPEYTRGMLTIKSDIFSLGVIILEVITGHKEYPYDIRKESDDFIELELQKWRNVLQEEPTSSTSLDIDCKQIKRCIQIGLICVNLERSKRPTMKKIIDMLQGSGSINWYITNELSCHDIQEEP